MSLTSFSLPLVLQKSIPSDMRPTQAILGASRLPLTPKRGNKDFYKGKSTVAIHGEGSTASED
jgi:hypothetical protein